MTVNEIPGNGEDAYGPMVVRGLDELRARQGAVLGPTSWLQVDQPRINAFAEITGDHQWIHVEPARASASPFGGTVAHGYLTLALCNFFLPQLIEVNGVSMGVNYGVNKVRFPSAVKAGARIRGRGELVSCDDIPGGVQTTIVVVAEIEGSVKPGCVVETLSRWMT